MIFAMSDIHGNLEAFRKRAEQLEPYLKKGDKLLLLGDFIDRGKDSFGCLKLAKELQDTYGKDQVIVIKGNHEVWFLDFLTDLGNDWLAEDRGYGTSKTFLSKEKYDILLTISPRDEKWDYIRNAIKSEHKEFLQWMEELPLYYETPTQIFTHAGVDEDIPEEEISYCTLATPDYIFTGKYPPTTGKFPKDIIAGHVASSHVAQDPYHRGVYFDGYSHYYIDGSVNKTEVLVCLAYDEDEKEYYELMDDGSMKPIRAKGNVNELDRGLLESTMDEAQQYYISQSLKECYQELLSKAKEKMSLVEGVIRLDSEFCELIERFETDQEFREQFHQDVEEIKQIRIPLEEERTE